MDQINGLIFNTLTSHKGINIPGMCALQPVKHPAELKGRKNLTPPRWEVQYSEEQIPGLPAVPDMVAAIIGDEARAREIYADWLAAQGVTAERIPSTIVLEGIGDIIYKGFNPTANLEKALNPMPAAPMKLTPRITGKHIAIIVGCVAVLAVAAGFYFHRTPEEKQFAYAKRMARELEKRNLERAQRGLDVVKEHIPPTTSADADTTAPKPAVPAETKPAETKPAEVAKPAETKPEPVKPTETKPAAKPAEPTKPAETKPAAKPAEPAKPVETKPATGPLYHVVLGVFSTPENANKFIAQAKDKSIPYSIVPFSGGKLIVSAFASPNQTETNAQREKLAPQYPDAWIYKQK